LGEPQSKRTRAALLVFTNLLSLGCLVWTLRDARLSELQSDFATMNWWWIAAAIAAQLFTYVWQALRWNSILAPVVAVPLRQSVRAIFVGLFASEALPVRAGEVLRCYLVSRWTKLPFSVSVSSVVIERVFDGLLMWAGLQVVLERVRLPRGFGYLNDGLGVFVATGLAVMAIALFGPRPKITELPPRGLARRWAIFRDDLTRIGHSWYLWLALLLTIPYLALQVVPVWVLFRGYDFDLPLRAAVALMLLLRLAAAVPQAPATLGLFQLVTKEFLERGFHIPAAEAARFSLVLWGVIKLPLLGAGAVALGITGAKITELTKAAEQQAEALDSGHPAES
jgi:glycosyltransferase 2 family protein